MIDRYTLRGACLSALLMLAAANVAAQSEPPTGGAPHPRIGVVLSGGSAKGFAHIGALQVLEEMGIPVDVVTGTSMGAIIGGLYAAGYTGAELEHLAETEDWDNFFRRPTDRRQQSFAEKLDDERFTITFPLERARPGLPAGVIPRQGIAEHLERYVWPTYDDTDLTRLPSAFGALVTDLATGEPILLHSGPLAQAIEASAAVPGAFAPLTLADGRRVIDGAVVRNIPAEDARALGADILICVDVSERLKSLDSLRSLVEIVDQTVAFRVQWADVAQRELCKVVISPELDGLPSLTFSRALPWIERGRSAATAHRAALQAIVDSIRPLRGPPVARRALRRVDSVFVRTVTWSTVSEGANGIAQGTIKLRDSSWVTQAMVEAAAARVYSTGRFDQVSYRIVPRNGGHDLVFDLAEADRDVLGLGVRYDTPRGVSLLASASVTDWISPGSTASLTGRLGEEQQFDARDVIGEGPNSHFVQTYRVTFTRTPLPRLRVPDDFTAPTLDVYQAVAEIGHELSSTVQVGISLSHEWSRDGANGPDTAWAARYQSYTTAGATVRVDTYDRTFLPSRGASFFWRSEVAERERGSNATFTRNVINTQGAWPVFAGISLLARADLGYASGVDLPLHDLFFLGGSVPSAVWPSQFIPFLGVDPQSMAGRAVQVAQGGVQAEPVDGWIVALRGNVGNVFQTWPVGINRSTYQSGMGLTVGTHLEPGPLSFTLASRSLRQKPVFEIVFGATF